MACTTGEKKASVLVTLGLIQVAASTFAPDSPYCQPPSLYSVHTLVFSTKPLKVIYRKEMLFQNMCQGCAGNLQRLFSGSTFLHAEDTYPVLQVCLQTELSKVKF